MSLSVCRWKVKTLNMMHQKRTLVVVVVVDDSGNTRIY